MREQDLFEKTLEKIIDKVVSILEELKRKDRYHDSVPDFIFVVGGGSEVHERVHIWSSELTISGVVEMVFEINYWELMVFWFFQNKHVEKRLKEAIEKTLNDPEITPVIIFPVDRVLAVLRGDACWSHGDTANLLNVFASEISLASYVLSHAYFISDHLPTTSFFWNRRGSFWA